jgi:pimeloyl-ACP methyl ester carboxylesterase
LSEALATVPFNGLKRFLVKNGYDSYPTRYQTLWGPAVYSSQDDTDAEIAARVRIWAAAVRNATYADKASLVGHSLGGLIGRYYVTQAGGAKDVYKLVTIGTPLCGSTKFYLWAFGLTPAMVRSKLHTSDGADTHNLRTWLSPTYECLYLNDHGTRGQPVGLLFPNLFQPTPSPADVGVGYYCIYGRQSTNRTPSELLLTPVMVGTTPWYRCAKTFSGEGDGTVLCQSAATGLSGSDLPVSTNTGHAFLPSDAAVMPVVLRSLEDGDYSP